MFNPLPPALASDQSTKYFSDWLDSRLLIPSRRSQAERLFQHLVDLAPPLGRLKQTPQTPPYHAEGQVVSEHVIRILTVILAISDQVSLTEVEDFVRDKAWLLDFQSLEHVIKTQAGFLTAYAVCHDLAKAETVAFDVVPGKLGEQEGFGVRGAQLTGATSAEISRFDKLRRAFNVNHSDQDFFNLYGISVHYPDHGRTGATDAHASTRQVVLKKLELSLSQAKLLTELIRWHMEIIYAFSAQPDPAKYAALAARAAQAGLHTPVFLDLLPAVVFLDAVAGSLRYGLEPGTRHDSQHCSADLRILINLFCSEREAMPERYQARLAAFERGRKQAARDVLKATELDADTVFEFLHTPIGPGRGQVMEQIYDLVRNPDGPADWGEHTETLRARARQAQRLLQERQLTL